MPASKFVLAGGFEEIRYSHLMRKTETEGIRP